MSELKFKLAAGTNVGLIRDNNEDNFVVCSDLGTSEWLIPQVGDFADLGEKGALLVVADGMGGANAGEVASAIAIETIQKEYNDEQLKELDVNDDVALLEFMVKVVKNADRNIKNVSMNDSSKAGMGTTLVMVWLLGDKAYVCWCGDSRCYVLNKSKGLVQLSKDHSYVQELVDNGELEPEMMHEHPLSNVITRCLGDVEKEAEPDTLTYRPHNGDVFMLCSDGLCGLVSDADITEIMKAQAEDLTQCKNDLISAALAAGGYDNVTVAMAAIEKEEKKEEKKAETKEEVKEEEVKAEEIKAESIIEENSQDDSEGNSENDAESKTEGEVEDENKKESDVDTEKEGEDKNEEDDDVELEIEKPLEQKLKETNPIKANSNKKKLIWIIAIIVILAALITAFFFTPWSEPVKQFITGQMK